MNYEQCLSYLEQVQNLGIKFGLDNVQIILKSLGSPQHSYPAVQIAGTNGKGSVCAMLTRILTLHGHRAGLYTSPHLILPEERIRIGEKLISKADFAICLTQLKIVIDSLIAEKKLINPPTYFETMTCLAYLYFKAQKVDIAVLEVGMGGRFDATNIVIPIVSVITTISPEHQKFLGDTLERIAFEKAGIIKPGVPVVCGVEAEGAFNVFRSRAEELGSDFCPVFSPNSFFFNKKNGLYAFEYKTDEGTYFYTPSLSGLHQGVNAATTIKVAEIIGRSWKKLDKENIIMGIESTRWEGRIEVISKDPLVVLDGAHNEEGAHALREYAAVFLPKPITLIYAAMRDKNIKKIADILFPVADRIFLTKFPFHKASAPKDMKALISQYFHPRIILEPDPFFAIERAFKQERSIHSNEGSVLIAGSLFLIGEAKRYFKKRIREGLS